MQHTTAMRRRLLLVAVLALGTVACEPGDRDGEPTLDPEGTGAPLYDQGVDPAETQSELDD
jgi:hypothetical protein